MTFKEIFGKIPIWLKVVAAAIILIFIFFYTRSCSKVDYWKGQYDIKQKAVEDLGYTIADLKKESSTKDEAKDAKIGELQGKIDSLNTVLSGSDEVVQNKDAKIADLEKTLAVTVNIESQNEILRSEVKVLKEKVEILETKIVDQGRIIELKDGQMAAVNAAYEGLKIDFAKALEGWKIEKDANLAGQALVQAQAHQITLLKFQATIGKLGLGAFAAAGLYLLLSK